MPIVRQEEKRCISLFTGRNTNGDLSDTKEGSLWRFLFPIMIKFSIMVKGEIMSSSDFSPLLNLRSGERKRDSVFVGLLLKECKR